MKKILYIGGFELPDKNAAAQRVMANAKILRELGFDVSFIDTSKDKDPNSKIVDGFKCESLLYPNNTREWIYRTFKYINSKEILNHHPDIVILYNFPAIPSLRFLYYCNKHNIKVIQDITEWYSEKGCSLKSIIKRVDTKLRMNYCLKKMDGIIAISRFLYNKYKKSTTTILIPPTVDMCEKKWNRNRKLSVGNRIKLVYAGSAGYGKKDQLDKIIFAVANFSRIQLEIYGMTKEQYEKGYQQSSVPENVIFHGRVSHLEAIKAVQNSDFQMLVRENSRKNNAGFPTKFVESMCCGTPIIGTLTSNLDEYLKNGKNGFIISQNQSLEDVFKHITKCPKEEIIKMKETCRSIDVFNYTYYKKVFSELISNLYKKVTCE